MNLPNRLTLFRVILVPVFVVFMLLNTDSGHAWNDIIALIIFIVASLTDMLDGRIARKRNLITDFGKFMDPLADKLLVCAALICLLQIGLVPAWPIIIIISREFVISGFRLVAAEHQNVIAASRWGKFKTVFQMVAVILYLVVCVLANYVFTYSDIFALEIVLLVVIIVATVAFYVAVVLTVVSMIDYIVKNRAVFQQQD